MGPGRLFWKLFLGNVLLMALVVVTCVWFISREVEHGQDRELTRTLQVQAAALRAMFDDRFDRQHADQLDQLLKRIGHEQKERIRITLILADGSVLADSEADPESMGSHAGRKEVSEAMHAGWGKDVRLSQTLDGMAKYVAVAVGAADSPGHKPKGVVRVAMPIRTIRDQVGSMQRLIWGSGLLALVAVTILALGLAQLWSRPIRRITLAARGLSRGDLSASVRVGGSDELATLAQSLNEMRMRLAGQLATIDRQRRTLESLLAQLHEGVIVAGPDGRILLINPAAARMLGLPSEPAETIARLHGHAVEECIPRHELQQMLLPRPGRSASRQGSGEADTLREVRLPSEHNGPDRALLARASDIILPSFRQEEEREEGSRPPRPGRLLVLTDVTELTRVIQMKADFAANASHELRTPLSAIRAAVETLQGTDLAQAPQQGRSLIEMIDRHSRRLELLVTDLLELSRLESAPAPFKPAEIRTGDLFSELYQRHAEALTAKTLHWKVNVPAHLDRMIANPHLVRIALNNLVDNAIKFTDPGGRIDITCDEAPATADRPQAVLITVADTGCGIPLDEQDRVFERFYQVERARSGSTARGTGLGLSIVRHAVAAMKGTVELHSEPGKGTTVRIAIPQPPAGTS